MKKTLLKLAGRVRGIGVVGAFAFAAGATGAAAPDPLRAAIAGAADEIASSVNRLRLPAGSAVSVRPARMEIEGIFVDCPELARVLRNYLRDALEKERARRGFDFIVRPVGQSEEAHVEVNTSWWHDVRNDRDVLSAHVTVTADGRFVAGDETNWEVDADVLTRRQRACLMKWTYRGRSVKVADGQQVVVLEEPSLRGRRLKEYEPGDEVEVVGDLKPLGTRDSWQLVWLSDRETYGYAKVGPARVDPSPGQPFTVTTVPSSATVRLLGHAEAYRSRMLLRPGSYRVEASAEGYEAATETVAHGAEPTEHRIVLREAGRQVGERFRDCPECPEMAVLPSGSFSMGSPSGEQGRHGDEGPVHEVRFGRPFALGVYEVTFAEWGACVSGGGCGGYRPGDQGWGRGYRPVINVSWEDAQAYAAWLSEKTGKDYRLPSESEWEYSARAGTMTPFHTGRTISTDQVNYGWNRGRTVSVGTFDPNAWGLHDMHGNVREWVEDCWNGSYSGAPEDGSAWLRGDCDRRVVRGGSWYDGPSLLRAALRSGDTAGIRFIVGFRVARTLAP